MSLTRDLPIGSVGFTPINAVHPPASQHGVFIPFAPFGRCNGKRTNVRCARSRSQCLTLQAACVAGKTSHSDVATAIGQTQLDRGHTPFILLSRFLWR